MMGRQKKRAEKLFYCGFRLEERIPGDHLLRRIEEAVDFGFVRRSVGETYGYNGHESEDPIVIVKLMLLLFLEGVKSERELMRVLPMRLDWLWFLELDLDSEVANHSVLSKARARGGVRGCLKSCLCGWCRRVLRPGWYPATRFMWMEVWWMPMPVGTR